MAGGENEEFQLILLRHGECSWDEENKFTGWRDSPLSVKSHAEAAATGALMQGGRIEFDIAYTSFLKRAIRTLWHAKEQTDRLYVHNPNSWRLSAK
jgi:2,3-bisphosphoglycerate-dependent phosphoglycerate mutase